MDSKEIYGLKIYHMDEKVTIWIKRDTVWI